MDGSLHHVAAPVGLFLSSGCFVGHIPVRAPVLPQIPQRGEIIVEQARSIPQVLHILAEMECGEHLFEDVVAVADVGVDGHLHLLWLVGTLRIDGGMFASEMHPVDGPFLPFVGSIFMRLTGRQNEIVVFPNLVFPASQFVEPTAIHAVDQHKLVDAHRADAVVVLSHGVVADVGDEEAADQWVLLFHLHNHWGKNH